jgi:hypothetical protein|tara:strand:- start:23878 stop:24741 length:864 start_codon:yes stop_codon:yes gene_type:complete
MPLTIDRTSYTAAQLNTVFSDLRDQLAYNLPAEIRTPVDSTSFDDLELNESDDVAVSVHDPDSVARALAYLANKRVTTSNIAVAGMFQHRLDTSSNTIIDVVNRVTEVDKVDSSRNYNLVLHASVTMTTGLTVTSERFVTNDSVGWYASGFIGKEEFTDAGYDGWYSGAGTTISTSYFGEKGYDNWDNQTSYKLGQTETFDQGWPQGTSPTPSSGGSDLQKEDLSSQAGSSTGIFTLSNEYASGTLRVYWNGQRQDSSTITELNNTQFNFSEATIAGDRIVVDYSPA